MLLVLLMPLVVAKRFVETENRMEARSPALKDSWGQANIEFGRGSKATSMPKVDPDVSLEVFYAEVPISGSDLAEHMSQFHSGLTFKYEDKDHKKKMWTLELYAKYGMSSAVCPKLDGEGLPTWNDTVVVAFREDESLNSKREMHLKETHVGSIKGSVFNHAYHEFVARYLEKHSTYQLFDVISSDSLPDENSAPDILRPMKSATCDSFSEASMTFLEVRHGLGSTLKSKPKTRRNYAFILAVSTDPPEELDRSDPDVKEFYQVYADVCNKSVPAIMRTLAWAAFGEKAIVQANGKYYKFLLDTGTFAAKYALTNSVAW